MKPSMAQENVELTATERAALAIGRLVNERPIAKRAQSRFLKSITKAWVNGIVGRRTYVEGAEWLRDFQPDRGVMLAANHRSFFDMFLIMLAAYRLKLPFVERIIFPVRSNFFYDSAAGIAINHAIGGGTLYPPIFRDPAKSKLTKDAVNRIVEFLRTPGNVVGLHPEGTRGADLPPYEMLKSQPGIGQMILQAKPVVIPVWIEGLSNSLFTNITTNFSAGVRTREPVIIVFGTPSDYSQFTASKPRAALYKRCSDKVRLEILELGQRARQLRADMADGRIGDRAPNWLNNLAS